MSVVHRESRRVHRQVEAGTRRGKSLFEALFVAALDGYRQERHNKEIAGVWVDELEEIEDKAPSID